MLLTRIVESQFSMQQSVDPERLKWLLVSHKVALPRNSSVDIEPRVHGKRLLQGSTV